MQTVSKKTRNPGVVKLMGLCDPHFANKSPPAFKADYFSFLAETVTKVINFCAKEEVDAILWAGDIFHLKDPSKNPVGFVTEVLKIMQQVYQGGMDNLLIGGNHDLRYGTLEAGYARSALELLVTSGGATLLDDVEYLYDAGTHKVRVAGGSYLNGQAQHVRDKKKDGADYLVGLGHFWLGKTTGEFFGETLYGLEWFDQSEVDLFLVGHHHEDKGMLIRGDKYFVSHGSISITGAHGHDMSRKPAGALITLTKEGEKVKTDVQFVRPKVPEISELLDLDRHQQIKEEKKVMKEFIDSLSTLDLGTTDPLKILEETAPSKEVQERAEKYIALAEESK